MELVQYSVVDRKAHIVLNRPEKRNALSAELVSALQEAFSKAEQDEQVKVIILKANGKVFCAGADLAYLEELRTFSDEENLADSHRLKELLLGIYQCPKPVIARVQGPALAGGCGLATICDFIYCDREAKFGYTEVRIGFVPALVLVFLIRKIGESRATGLLLSGELIGAEEALQLGLVHRVCDDLATEVEALADRLIQNNSGQSMQLTKNLMRQVQGLPLEEALDAAASTNATARNTQDCRKGIAAFLAKRSIQW